MSNRSMLNVNDIIESYLIFNPIVIPFFLRTVGNANKFIQFLLYKICARVSKNISTNLNYKNGRTDRKQILVLNIISNNPFCGYYCGFPILNEKISFRFLKDILSCLSRCLASFFKVAKRQFSDLKDILCNILRYHFRYL